ncbi:MAG: ribonuclease HII [Alicyclobacillus sp.]|nr:ribonuclease HII [Alicyclobacillus sp.]
MGKAGSVQSAEQPWLARWREERRLLRAAGRAATRQSIRVCYAGVDEAGRGALAGPVVAAAVVLGRPARWWQGLDDSKRLTAAQRERLYRCICGEAQAWAVGWATVAEIERYNILHATRLAMARAVQGLPLTVDVVLVDGPYAPWWHSDWEPVTLTVVDGDARCLSIAAASVVAKVERDRRMAAWASLYPEYGFERHAGYSTQLHVEALARYGPSPLHRPSFGPVQRSLQRRLDLP